MEKAKLAILCDFDGTVTKEDVGFRIYTRFGDERWLEINKRWRRGEISSRECLIGEYSLIDASEQEVKEFILKMEIDPGFLSIAATCRDNNIPIAIVSDGFDFYINTVLEKYGLSDIKVFCNELKFNDRKVELSFPFYEEGCGVCGNCKKLHVKRLRATSRAIVYVGDGLSDRFASRVSDVIFAKGELMGYLMENNVEFIGFNDLSDVNRWLIRFLADGADLKGRSEFADPCQEVEPPGGKNSKKPEKKDSTKKRRMKKTVGDMGDGRYIIYYEWS